MRGWLDPSLGPLFLEGNAVLALFNLLPFLPLDGGQFVRALAAFHRGYGQATRLFARAGEVAGGVLLALGGVALLFGYLLPQALLLGYFLFRAAGRERRLAAAEELLRLYAGFWRKRGKVSRPVHLLVEGDFPLGALPSHLSPAERHLIWVQVGKKVAGPLSEEEVWGVLSRRGREVTAREALAFLTPRSGEPGGCRGEGNQGNGGCRGEGRREGKGR